MSSAIFVSNEPVTLVGGGDADGDDLDFALAHAPRLTAADGGAALALSAGQVPEAVFGDFDSLDPKVARMLSPGSLHRIPEQDTTDFDKSLRSITAPLVLAVGFLGARVDHQLAAFSTLLRHADRPCVLVGPRELVFMAPPRISVDLAEGDTVSLFPMREVSGRSRGLEWPIDGLSLAPGGRTGTSNRALGKVTLEIAAPGLLVLVPRHALDAVVAALTRPGPAEPRLARWPAPAG